MLCSKMITILALLTEKHASSRLVSNFCKTLIYLNQNNQTVQRQWHNHKIIFFLLLFLKYFLSVLASLSSNTQYFLQMKGYLRFNTVCMAAILVGSLL